MTSSQSPSAERVPDCFIPPTTAEWCAFLRNDSRDLSSCTICWLSSYSATHGSVPFAVGALYVMGGAERSGNSSLAAEYNFHCDPEAAHLVLLKVRANVAQHIFNNG